MTETYTSAVNEALGRLTHAGFYNGGRSEFRGFIMHAPMAAEALATLGFCDEVPGWIDWNVAARDIGPAPEQVCNIDPASEAEWRSALGQSGRLADWVVLFRRQIGDLGWQATLTVWWPRLVPGMLAGLTHGLIRTAHAIRSVASSDVPSELQLHELGNGLALWAGLYEPTGGRGPAATAPAPGSPGSPGPQDGADPADVVLTRLTAECAGRYTALRPGVMPVPLIHTITAPAALRMVLPLLPPEFAGPSCQAVSDACKTLLRRFERPAGPAMATADLGEGDPAEHERLIHQAVELRDEHGIKLVEAANREYRVNPDPRYFAAARHALELLKLGM